MNDVDQRATEQAQGTPFPGARDATATASLPALTWEVSVTPANPRSGETITVVAVARGPGGLPQYTLSVPANSVVTLDSPAGVSTGGRLGAPATWTLKAAGAGTVVLGLSVNYERSFESPNSPFFAFTIEQAPPVSITVRP